MKNVSFACLLSVLLLTTACEPEKTQPQPQNQLQVPEAVIREKLTASGFDLREGFRRQQDGYLVEYDIKMTEKEILDLDEALPVEGGKGARVKHYRSYNLVHGNQRVIRVSMGPGFDWYMHSALDTALRRFNDLPIALHFIRVPASASADIHIKAVTVSEASLDEGYTGFPENGNPYPLIQLDVWKLNANTVNSVHAATAVAHNIGHTLGFRHTDLGDNSFSCPQLLLSPPSVRNEGAGPQGAVHIPGTPTGPVKYSWMLRCQWIPENRPFTREDQGALLTTYPKRNTNTSSILEANEELLVGQELRSPDGKSQLILQSDGNLVLYKDGKAVWASHTAGKKISRCVMQSDNNLVLYEGHKPHWATGTSQPRVPGKSLPNSFLVLHNGGVLAMYKNTGRLYWSSSPVFLMSYLVGLSQS